MEDRLGVQMLRVRTALDSASSEAERSAALSTLRGVSAGWLRTDLPSRMCPTLMGRQCLHWPIAFPEVFLADGRTRFDVIVANPPFLGGKRISGANGVAFREYLAEAVALGTSGSADLVAYFILQMSQLAGVIGTLATNTVSQGDAVRSVWIVCWRVGGAYSPYQVGTMAQRGQPVNRQALDGRAPLAYLG